MADRRTLLLPGDVQSSLAWGRSHLRPHVPDRRWTDALILTLSIYASNYALLELLHERTHLGSLILKTGKEVEIESGIST